MKFPSCTRENCVALATARGVTSGKCPSLTVSVNNTGFMPIAELIDYIFGAATGPLAATCAQWLTASSRFRLFAETYRDKIRKKVRGIQEAAGYPALHAELYVASCLLQDRRCQVEYEKYGVGKQRAPDLTVTFRAHSQFNVEVTRLRPLPTETAGAQLADPAKLANTLCEKLGQLPPSISNVIWLLAEAGSYQATDLQSSLRLLQERAAQKDDTFFARRNLNSVRDFHRYYLRLSGIVLGVFVPGSTPTPAMLWLNPQTKHPLPVDVQNLLRALC